VRILFIIPSLEHGGAAKQLGLLAAALPRERFEICVSVLGRNGPQSLPLEEGGLRVVALGWHRSFDPGPLWRLGQLAAEFRPQVVHAWGPLGLRVAGLVPALRKLRLIASAPFQPRERGLRVSRLDRWLLRRTERVAAFGPFEAESCRQVGLSERQVVRVTPAVRMPAAEVVPPVELPRHFIACVGPMAPHKGFRDAVWAYDILRFVQPDTHLVMVGNGPDAPRLVEFVRACQALREVHFLGPRQDVSSILARADVVWVPSRAPGGVNVAMEAMAVGRTVVATRLPDLVELIEDGKSGVLVPPGDKPAFAAQTRRLIEDPERRARLGAAARERVDASFTVARLVEEMSRIYERGP